MAERHPSDIFMRSGLTSLLLLIAGLVLLWHGNQELQQLRPDMPGGSPIRLDNRTFWLLIFGSASSIAGITGLLRKK